MNFSLLLWKLANQKYYYPTSMALGFCSAHSHWLSFLPLKRYVSSSREHISKIPDGSLFKTSIQKESQPSGPFPSKKRCVSCPMMVFGSGLFGRLPFLNWNSGKQSSVKRNEVNPYRSLGVAEDASYEEVEAAYRRLVKKYQGNEKQLIKLEMYKDKIFEDQLRARIQGKVKAKVRSSPAEKSLFRKKFQPPKWIREAIKLPDKKYMQKTALVTSIFIIAGFITPNLATTCMSMSAIASIAFLYNRGLPEPPKDEFGYPGEIRPTNWKIALQTVLLCLTFGFIALGIAQAILMFVSLPNWLAPDALVNLCVCFGFWLCCTFCQTQEEQQGWK